MGNPLEVSHDLGRSIEGPDGPGEIYYETIQLPIDALPNLVDYKIGDEGTMRINYVVKDIHKFEDKDGKKKGTITLEIHEAEMTEPNIANRTHDQFVGDVKETNINELYEK